MWLGNQLLKHAEALAAALEGEVTAYTAAHLADVDDGRRLVVRSGQHCVPRRRRRAARPVRFETGVGVLVRNVLRQRYGLLTARV
jgi:hypothetical protein